jgi:hypothetical protein
MAKNEQHVVEADPLLSPAQAARYLSVSTPTLARWRQTGCGPRFLKLGDRKQSTIRYRLSDLNAFVERAARASTSDPGPGVTP